MNKILPVPYFFASFMNRRFTREYTFLYLHPYYHPYRRLYHCLYPFWNSSLFFLSLFPWYCPRPWYWIQGQNDVLKYINKNVITYCSPFPPPNTPPAASASPWAAFGFLAKILRTNVSKASFTLVFSLAF